MGVGERGMVMSGGGKERIFFMMIRKEKDENGRERINAKERKKVNYLYHEPLNCLHAD